MNRGLALVALLLGACGSHADSGARDSGVMAQESAAAPDRCARCESSADCSSGFCSRVHLEILGREGSFGRCGERGVEDDCNCGIAFVDGTSVCVGTGCPGTPERLCDRLTGAEWTGDSMADDEPSDVVDPGDVVDDSGCPAPHVCVPNTTSTADTASYACSLGADTYPITCTDVAECIDAGFDPDLVVCAGTAYGFADDYCFQGCTP